MDIVVERNLYGRKTRWYKYLKPKRLTLMSGPPIFKWLCFIITLNKEEYQKYLYKKLKQHTFVYCPNCNLELLSSNSLIADADYVYFKCKGCGRKSKWDFDLPCPELIDEGKDVTINVNGKKW